MKLITEIRLRILRSRIEFLIKQERCSPDFEKFFRDEVTRLQKKANEILKKQYKKQKKQR